MRNHPQGHPRQGQNKGTTHPRHPRHNQIPPENRQNHTHPTPHTRGDHPRIRGEHDDRVLGAVRLAGSSPHTRGAPEEPIGVIPGIGIIPAYAGSTSSPASRRMVTPGSSPHTRGAPAVMGCWPSARRIIPAYAGSTRPEFLRGQGVEDHPRIRGEHDARSVQGPFDSGSSPHTRGARRLGGPRDRGAGIIPAYAGSTAQRIAVDGAPPDHPRIRGEHTAPANGTIFADGSSPHTRGALALGDHVGVGPGIIPAYAGSTPPSVTLGGSSWDHPRIRGEHPPALGVLTANAGSSPHTRGALLHKKFNSSRDRIIPAYAGSTRAAARPMWPGADHPRIRGEHTDPRSEPVGRLGSSPHTRGAREYTGMSPSSSRIIPAYAGSTHAPRTRRPRGPDHPRIRGEH